MIYQHLLQTLKPEALASLVLILEIPLRHLPRASQPELT
jgi:hypothetical protein